MTSRSGVSGAVATGLFGGTGVLAVGMAARGVEVGGITMMGVVGVAAVFEVIWARVVAGSETLPQTTGPSTPHLSWRSTTAPKRVLCLTAPRTEPAPVPWCRIAHLGDR